MTSRFEKRSQEWKDKPACQYWWQLYKPVISCSRQISDQCTQKKSKYHICHEKHCKQINGLFKPCICFRQKNKRRSQHGACLPTLLTQLWLFARIELSLRQRILIEHFRHRWHNLVLHQFIKFCFFSTT